MIIYERKKNILWEFVFQFHVKVWRSYFMVAYKVLETWIRGLDV